MTILRLCISYCPQRLKLPLSRSSAALPPVRFPEQRLAKADVAGRHLHQLVVLDVLQRHFQLQLAGRFQKRMFSSLPAARMFVSFFSLVGLTARSLSRAFSPTIIPAYTSSPWPPILCEPWGLSPRFFVFLGNTKAEQPPRPGLIRPSRFGTASRSSGCSLGSPWRWSQLLDAAALPWPGCVLFGALA